MNLKLVSKQALLADTEKLVREERRITTAILWHLHEIERRRLFAELGFASLFEYCTVQLKYSAGAAQRRISSMRLLRELPEIETKINTGELNVSALSHAASVFRQAKLESKAFTLEAKKELITKLEGRSHRECEKIIAEAAPELSRPSRERVIAVSRTEIRFEVDDALYGKIQKLKGLFAHKLSGSSDIKDLIELLVEQALEKAEQKSQVKQSVPALEVKRAQPYSITSRYIPKAIRAAAWQKAQGQCSYVDPHTRRRCSSRYALEFDHIQPLALGGKTEVANIRLLCRAHNQLAAIQHFGLRKMQRHWNRLRS